MLTRIAVLGIVLTIVAAIGLMIGTTIPGSPLQELVCPGGGELMRHVTVTNGRQTGSEPYCKMPDGSERETSFSFPTGGFAGVGILFGALLIVGRMLSRSSSPAPSQSTAGYSTPRSYSPPSSPAPAVSSDSASLTGRLKELKDALDAGLITELEYEEQREAMLEKHTG